MSKTQEKRALAQATAADFVAQRRVVQYEFLKSNHEVGKKLFLDNKDKLSPEDIATIEGQIVETEALLEKLKAEAGSYASVLEKLPEATDSQV